MDGQKKFDCIRVLPPHYLFLGRSGNTCSWEQTFVVWSLQVDPNITYQCMDQNLNKIPVNIPSSVKNLDLSFNTLKILGSHSFSNFPELQFLDLSR